jgi:hypothetical protein
MTKLYNLIFLTVLLISLIGCDAVATPEGVVEEPQPATATSAVLSDAPTPTPAAATVAPTATAVAGAVVATAPPVVAQALTNLNLRAGPGTTYGLVGSLPAQAQITLLGRNEASSWFLARDNAGTEVWLVGDPSLVQIDRQLAAGLPVVEAPLLAYDASNVKVNEVLNMIPLVLHNPNSFTCASHAGLNNFIISLAEGNVIGPHAGDFVHNSLGNVLFKYTNGSLRLIRENPVARFDGGAETLPLDTALKLFEQGEIVWNGKFGDWPARGVTGCDESAP